MSTRSLSLLRSVLPLDGEMKVIISNCHSIPQPIFRWHKQFQTYSHRRQKQEHRQDDHGRYYKNSRLFVASGMGLTLASHTGSFDSDHLQNFCETNFDTIRQSRPSVPRSTLPSFTPGSTPYRENSSVVTRSHSSADDIEDPKPICNKPSYPRARPTHQSFASVEPHFNPPPIASHSSAHPHKNLERNSQSSWVNHHNPPVACHPSGSSHQPLRYLSPSASHPAGPRDPTLQAPDPSSSAISPNCQQSAPTRLSHRLRNCHSLQFVRQEHQQSPDLSHFHSIHPPSRRATPLVTSHHNSDQSPSAPSSPSQTTFSAAFLSSAELRPPEPLPFPAANSVTSQPTKFTNFVRSTLQKRTRSSNFQSQPPPLSDLKPERHHLPITNCTPYSHHHSSSGSLALGVTSENCKPSLLKSFAPRLSMSRVHEAEFESLSDQRPSFDKPVPPLRSCHSQSVLNVHYQKKSLNASRSQSALNARDPNAPLNRPGSSRSSLGNTQPLTASGSGFLPHYSSRKNSNLSSGDSPPRKSLLTTQLSRLAHLLAPSPAPKHPPLTSSLKASSLTSKPKSSSTGSSSSRPSEVRLKRASFTVPDPLSSGSHGASTTMPITTINWRATISDREYRTILETWGPTEVHRQQLIWELFQTETVFLEHVTLIFDYFINPLKKSECGSWVAGVPEAAQQLFSDLDQIANLHSEIVMGMNYNRMCEKKRNNAPVVIRFATMMAAFVPRLRIYERYLVCFEHVCAIIDRLSADQADNFGVFVKIQSDAAGLGGMTLTSYLLKPIQRLMKYPLFFRQLDETTPVGHPDHSPTSNLWKATDGIIRSMQDVKGLEDDHNTLRNLEEQLIGLPDGLVLANRRRKLVARGTFQRVHPSHKDMVKLSEPSRNRVMNHAGPPSSLPFRSDRINNTTGYRMARCLSPVSDSSENSQDTQSPSSYNSIITDSTLELTKSHLAPINRGARTSWSNSGCSADSSNFPDPSSQDWAPIKSKPSRPLLTKKSSHNLMRRGPTTELVEVILLTDLIMFCVRETLPKKIWRPNSKNFDDSYRLRLLHGVGISKLLEAEDVGGQIDGFDDLIRLELYSEMKKTTTTNENDLHEENVIYLSSHNSSKPIGNGGLDSRKASRASMGSWPALLPSTTPNMGGMSTEQDWKCWLKEFKKLELQTHNFYRRHLKHSEQKRRRSATGKIDISIKRCSSMNNLQVAP